MTTGARIAALLTAGALAAGLSACGDDDVGEPIPRGKARQLENLLDRARDQVADGACDDARDTVDEARAAVDGLDEDGVGSDVQDALGDGIDNLRNLAVFECEPEEEVETTPETVPEQPVPPPTTETTPPPTETTPPPTETTPPPTTEEPPPDEGTGGAQFDPNADLPPGQAKKQEK